MARYVRSRRSRRVRDIVLALIGLALVVGGVLTVVVGGVLPAPLESPVFLIMGFAIMSFAIMGGVILLAFAFSWIASLIIAGEVESLSWLLLIEVGAMAIPLESLPRRIVVVLLLVVGLWWLARRVLRREAQQAQRAQEAHA